MTVTEVAQGWVGRNFKPGVTEQCAAFVRTVFQEAGVSLPVAKRPADWAVTSGLPQGPGYANSLSGDELGPYVGYASLQPGDIVTFRNTYGSYPVGTITHVGIYVGNGEMVHRPTAARPVERVALAGYWQGLFAEARRPIAVVQGDKPKLKLFANQNGMTLVVDEPLQPGSYQLDSVELVAQIGPRK